MISKRAHWSAEAQSEAQEEDTPDLSELQRLLEIVGLEVITESILAVAYSESWGEDFR